MTLLYKRSLKVVYGDQNATGIGPVMPFVVNNIDDDGLRVQFDFYRNNRGMPDKGDITIFNLPKKFRKSIKDDLEDQWRLRKDIQNKEKDPITRGKRLKQVADAYRVSIFAGYGGTEDNLELVFRGDLIDVCPEMRQGGLDTQTKLELGDTLLALRDSYMARSFGTGATMTNIIESAAAAADLELDEAGKAFITGVGPNSVITKVNNGYVAVGRVADTISELIDLFGLQWWVRDGKLYFVPQGATLKDYAIQLQQGRDLLDFSEERSYQDSRGRALLIPGIVPGRGLILLNKDGQPIDRLGYRVNSTRIRGDTGGNAWWIDFEASAVDRRIMAPAVEFSAKEFQDQDLLDLLERRFDGAQF